MKPKEFLRTLNMILMESKDENRNFKRFIYKNKTQLPVLAWCRRSDNLAQRINIDIL